MYKFKYHTITFLKKRRGKKTIDDELDLNACINEIALDDNFNHKNGIFGTPIPKHTFEKRNMLLFTLYLTLFENLGILPYLIENS